MERDPLVKELKELHGPLLGASALISLLGFRSHDSCMRALRSGALDVPTFRLPGRPGHFILTEDFVDWLLAATKRNRRRLAIHARTGDTM